MTQELAVTHLFDTKKALFADLIDSLLELSILGSFSDVGYTVRSKLYGWDTIYPIHDVAGGLNKEEVAPLTAVITGFSSGIGLATSLELARNNWQIIGIASNRERCTNALENIREVQSNLPASQEARANIFTCEEGYENNALEKLPLAASYAITADVAELSQIDQAVNVIKKHNTKIDLLIHCAGKIYPEMHLTKNGFESTLALHVLGPHLLTKSLLELMPIKTTGYLPRIIWVSSGGMYAVKMGLDKLLYCDKSTYRSTKAYAYAKRIQVELAEIWAIKLAEENRLAFSMHPGFVDTRAIQEGIPLFTKLMKPFLRTPLQGADTLIYLALLNQNEALRTLNGSFILDRKPRSTSKLKSTVSSVSEKILTFETVEKLISDREAG